MPLYDITKKPAFVDPKDAEQYDVLVRAAKTLNVSRFMKDIRIIDQALQNSIRTAEDANRLAFTKAGFLVGHQSVTPHADVLHIWESAEIAYPSQLPNHRTNEQAWEFQLKFVGGLVRWRISVLPDMWLVYRRESGKYNKTTGKEIRISEYWINNDFVFQKKATLTDLIAKYN